MKRTMQRLASRPTGALASRPTGAEGLRTQGTTRRRLLQGLGLGAGSLFLPSLMRRSSGADASVPQRVVFLMTFHGTVYDNWNMRPGSQPTNRAWEAELTGMADSEFSPILAPLHPFRDRMLVLDGVDLVTIKPQGSGIGHYDSPVNAMTGSGTIGEDREVRSTTPSIDQILAEAIARPDRFASLEIGTRADERISFATPGQALPRETRAERLWDRLFPNGTETDNGPPTVASRLRAKQSSVLDLVAQEYTSLAPRLSTEDRQKLDQHSQMVRDLELRLAGFEALECTTPTQPEDPRGDDPDVYNLRYSQFAELLTIALACDATRVVSYTLGQMPNTAFGAPPGDVHQLFAHAADPPNDTPIGIEQMTNYNRHHANHVLEFLQRLDSVPEGNGTMLDNTLVVWLNEMASGNHHQDPYPMVLFGGSNVPFQFGRYVFWPSNGPTPADAGGYNSDRPTGMPQNRVLTAIAHAFGVETDVGVTSIEADNGSTIDCSGPADRLLV